jgi:hypothetical protein
MSAGVGLVVKCDGSGCRLVEYDGSGAVVGQGQRITLSETSLTETKPVEATPPAVDATVELAALLARVQAQRADVQAKLAEVRAQLTDGSTLTGTDQDPQAVFTALAELVGGYSEAARRRPDLWRSARSAAYLDGPNGADGGDDPNQEVAHLVEQAMADYGLTASEASCMVMQERPDLWHRTRRF